jgi:preprotein translocase subunit SecE
MTKHRKRSAEESRPNGSEAPKPAAPSAAPRLKAKKDEEVRRPNAAVRLWTFFKDARRELTRVSWPTRKETFKSTAVLLVFVAVSAVYLALVDGVLTRVLRLIVG